VKVRKKLESGSARVFALASACAVAAAGCAAGMTSPSGNTLQLSCPADVTHYTPTGSAATVSYPQPTSTGGVAPVSSSCTPASGTTFSPGTNPVNCSGRDAQAHVAACTFKVTVAKTPEVSATQYVSFGDSITEGKTSTCSSSLTLGDEAPASGSFQFTLNLEAGPNAYPRVLEGELRARYTLQSIAVVNQGFGGARVTDELGGASLQEFQRFQDALRISPTPQVVLLLEGTNDIALHAQTADIIKGLRDMVREAKNRGVKPVLGAILPRVGSACKGGGASVDEIPNVNALLHAMADSEGAVFVDLYQEFGSNFAQYIGIDGLHPNDAGYHKIADVFMASITAQFEAH